MAEDSRAKVNMPGYVSIGGVPGVARKLIERAQAGEGQEILPSMFRTRPENLVGPSGERNVHSVEEITRGLGLDRVDEQKVQNMIGDIDPSFTPKGHQRSFLATAKLTGTLRTFRNIPADTRMEIVTRTRSYWRHEFPVDYAKVPTMRYGERSATMAKSGVRLMMNLDGSPIEEPLIKKFAEKFSKPPTGKGKKPTGGVKNGPIAQAREQELRTNAKKKTTQGPPQKTGAPKGPPMPPKGATQQGPMGAPQGPPGAAPKGPPPIPQGAAKPQMPTPAGAPAAAGPSGASKPPPGFSPVPNSKVGAWHMKQGDHYIYWRPGVGVTTSNPDEGGAQKPGAPQGGASVGAKPPPVPAGAMQKPGAPPAGPQGAPQGAGPQGAAGKGAQQGPAPKFTPPQDGTSDEDALHHHVSQRQAHMAAAKKHGKTDPQRASAHRQAQDQHTKAANEITKKLAKQDPAKAQSIIDRARGKGGDNTAPLPQEGPEQQAFGPEQGVEGPAFEGAQDPDQAAQDGYGRAPAGVRQGADGSRETAAAPRTRTVPEAQSVRAVRESLGRAMNIMGDLSAAHEHIDGLEGARQKIEAMPRGDRRRKHLMAQLDAEIAAARFDIVQLEGAHDHAMQEVKQQQAQMEAEGRQSHPIFKMFMMVMEKLQAFASAVSDKVEEITRNMSPEERAKKKSAEIFAQAVHEMSSRDGGGDGPTDFLGINQNEINALFNYNENQDANDQATQDALSRLDANDTEEVNPEDVSEDEGPSADTEEALNDVQGPMQAKLGEGIARKQKANDESAQYEQSLAGAKKKRDETEQLASKQAEAQVARANGGFKQQLAARKARAAGGAAKGTLAAKPGARAQSGEREKEPVDTNAKTIGFASRKKLAKAHYMAGTNAWSWAQRIGLQMVDDLRKAEAANTVLIVPTRVAPRHVPYFFNDLGG